MAPLWGAGGKAALAIAVEGFQARGLATAYDGVVSSVLADVLTGGDKDWFEVGGGVTVTTGNVDLSIGAETTIGRKDVSYQSYRGTVTFHF